MTTDTARANKTNKHFLPNGESFVINVKKDEDIGAWEKKAAFIVSIGEAQLAHNKMYTAAVIRLLATGIVDIKANGKHKTKAELLYALSGLIASYRERGALAFEELAQALSDGGYNAKTFQAMLACLHGEQLANAIEASLRNRYAASTICKTYLPDIRKALVAAERADAQDVIELLFNSFKPDRLAVDKATEGKRMELCSDRKAVSWDNIQIFLDNLDIDKASWKELSVYLALATGRRQAEIHGTATSFSFIDNEHVMFSGQLKMKNRADGKSSFPIRCHVPAVNVIAAFGRLCKLMSPMEPAAVNKKLSKPLSSDMPIALKAFFSKANISKYKDMRDIYAAKMAEEWTDKSITLSVFISGCMGHSEDDDKTAQTYQKIQLI